MSTHPPQSSESFGNLLRILRRRARLTQHALATRVGYSEVQINRYERGARQPDPEFVAARLIPALGVSADSEDAQQLIRLSRRPSAAAAPQENMSEWRATPPAPKSELLGRAGDAEAIRALITAPQARVVTLIGPPGVGKTSLAVRVANDLAHGYRHGALVVPLAAVTDAALLPTAILQALGVAVLSLDPAERLTQALRERHLLLVLDNFEQLLDASNIDGATRLINALARQAPQVAIVITSRAPLRLSAEQVYDVPPLDTTVATELFVNRARFHDPAFATGPQDAAAIAEICRRLDGLPLAIELAAARVRLFPPRVLLRKLKAPLDILTTGPRALPQRQRALRNTIDWSHGLLAAEERVFFRRLSIFADGCTLEAAAAIAGSGVKRDTLDLLQSLIEKNMLQVERGPGGSRFRLLEMMREYASEMLANSDESLSTAARSAAWYLAQVRGFQSDPATSESGAWFAWFDAEVNNLRAIIVWSLEGGRIAYGLRLIADLGITWRLHGPLRDGWDLTQRVLADPRAREHELLYAEALLGAAHVSEEIAEAEQSEAFLVEALAIFTRRGDARLAARALAHRGDHALTNGNYPLARQLLEESIAASRRLDDRKAVALALNWYGTLERVEGNFTRAIEIFHEMGRIARDIGSENLRYMAISWESGVHEALNDYERAERLNTAALRICEANGLTLGAAFSRAGIGSLALRRGDAALAVKYLGQAVNDLDRFGGPDSRAAVMIEYGFATHLNGDSERAVDILREGLRVFWDIQRISGVIDFIARLAWVAVDCAQFEHAARLFGAVAAFKQHTPVVEEAVELRYSQPRLAAARVALGDARFERFFAEGRALSREAALAYALTGALTSPSA